MAGLTIEGELSMYAAITIMFPLSHETDLLKHESVQSKLVQIIYSHI